MDDMTKHALTLLFDLDGTLTDPSEGITRCIQHALERLGRAYPPKAELLRYIGPSLRWTFPRLLGTEDEELIEAAVCFYRERFADVGLFENEVYAGVPELLEQLAGDAWPMYVVTSKPKVYADRIIQHFGFDRCFLGVYGPELSGRFDEKQELIGLLRHELPLKPQQMVMIGDRARDIESGKAHGTRTIGVTYGFGSEEELAAGKPDVIVRSPAEIRSVVYELWQKSH